MNKYILQFQLVRTADPELAPAMQLPSCTCRSREHRRTLEQDSYQSAQPLQDGRCIRILLWQVPPWSVVLFGFWTNRKEFRLWGLSSKCCLAGSSPSAHLASSPCHLLLQTKTAEWLSPLQNNSGPEWKQRNEIGENMVTSLVFLNHTVAKRQCPVSQKKIPKHKKRYIVIKSFWKGPLWRGKKSGEA